MTTTSRGFRIPPPPEMTAEQYAAVARGYVGDNRTVADRERTSSDRKEDPDTFDFSFCTRK